MAYKENKISTHASLFNPHAPTLIIVCEAVAISVSHPSPHIRAKCTRCLVSPLLPLYGVTFSCPAMFYILSIRYPVVSTCNIEFAAYVSLNPGVFRT